jgi:thiol-disulfide isomerase/thioredoxin
MSRTALIVFCAFCFAAGGNRAAGQTRDSSRAVEPIDVHGIEHLLHVRSGKALFLNVWATWCQPCVEEFPDLVTLYNEYRNAGIDIVAISVDYPNETESKILPFLANRNVPFTVYVASVKKDEDFINAVDSSWSGAVPATFILDAHGRQRAFVFGQKTFAFFKAEIDSVLGSK